MASSSASLLYAHNAEPIIRHLERADVNDLDRHDIRALLRSLVDIVVQMDRLPPGDGRPARYRMTEVWFDPAGKSCD